MPLGDRPRASVDHLDQRWPRRAVVIAFDESRGAGTARGGEIGDLFFHCTAIADGSRHIDVGTEVEVVVAPGHGGRLEARRVTPLV